MKRYTAHPKKSMRHLLCVVLCGCLLGGCQALPMQKPNDTDTVSPTATTTAPEATEAIATVSPTTTQERSSSVKLDVPYISQKGKYPTGCESVSAVMLLQYVGVDISVEEFIDDHLPYGKLWYEDGKLYGDDPNEVFIGNPYSENSYGCFAPVIEKACNSLLPEEEYTVSTVRGQTLAELCDTYVSQGIPVLTWVTIAMIDSFDSSQWILPDGSTFTWCANEHCMVLIGYDDNYYWFNDPYNGNGVVRHRRSLAERRYAEMGSQAVVVLRDPTI